MISEFCTIRGKKIFYAQNGSGSPVLYIHGNLGSHLWYSRVMEIEGVLVFAPDLPNFGRSDGLDSSSIDIYADYMLAFADKLDRGPLTLVGHSLGGAVAMTMAVRKPALFSRMLLVDSCPVDGLITPEAHYPVIESYRNNKELLKKGLKAVTPSMNDDAFLDELTVDAMEMNEASFSGNARALAEFGLSAETDRYTGSVLYLLGTLDPLISREKAEKSVSFFEGRLETLEGIGHSVMVESPGLFIQILKEFVL